LNLNVSGIYAIENIASGRRYIGSAACIRRRWKLHRRSSADGRAPSKLQRAWDKYGEATFRFQVLLVCSRADLLLFESRAMAAYDAVSSGYNSRPLAESNLGIKFGPPSATTRAKISAANRIAHRGRPGPWPKGKPRPREINEKQSRTRRTLFRQYEFAGKRMSLTDWAECIGITSRALGNRLSRGWPLARALTEPSRGY